MPSMSAEESIPSLDGGSTAQDGVDGVAGKARATQLVVHAFNKLLLLPGSTSDGVVASGWLVATASTT